MTLSPVLKSRLVLDVTNYGFLLYSLDGTLDGRYWGNLQQGIQHRKTWPSLQTVVIWQELEVCSMDLVRRQK